MIPRVPLFLRRVLAMALMVIAVVLLAFASGLDELIRWLTPEDSPRKPDRVQ